MLPQKHMIKAPGPHCVLRNHSVTSDMAYALIIDDEIDILFLLTGTLRKYRLKTNFVCSIVRRKKNLQMSHPH